MYAKRFEDVEEVKRQYGSIRKLLSKELTETLEVGFVKVNKGTNKLSVTHEDHEQAYIILSGRGTMRINDEEQNVEGGTIVYIPKQSEHSIANTGEDELVYIFVN